MRRELAHDAVDARADGQLVRLRLEVEVGGAVVDRPRDERVDAVDGGALVAGTAGGIEVGATARRRLRAPRSARPSSGRRGRSSSIDVRRGRHGEAHVEPEREAEVVGGEDVRRVGDGDEDEVVAQEADRDGLVAARVLLRQQPRHRRVDLHRAEVEVLELVLLGQEPGDVAGGDPAARDDDLAEPVPAASFSASACSSCSGVSTPSRRSSVPIWARWEASVCKAKRRCRGVSGCPTLVSIGLRCPRHEVRLPAGRRGAGAGRRRGGGRDRAGALHPARRRRRRRRDRGGAARRQDRPAADLRGRGRPLRPEPPRRRAARRSSSPSSRCIADTAKGNRPSFADAAPPDGPSRSTSASARSCARSASRSSRASSARRWTSSSSNDGPVTIVLDVVKLCSSGERYGTARPRSTRPRLSRLRGLPRWRPTAALDVLATQLRGAVLARRPRPCTSTSGTTIPCIASS